MDPSHVRLVWDRLKDRMLAFLRSKVSSPEDAEDLLQELFVRVHTGLCCLEEWTSLERWIYRVARNLVIDHYRSRKRHEPLDSDPGIPSPYGAAEAEEDPEARIAFSLRETAEELPAPYREALTAVEYEGLSVTDYARRSGISLSAAKSRVLRARERLKASLLECCHFELDRLGGIVNYEKRCAECDLRRAASASRPASGNPRPASPGAN